MLSITINNQPFSWDLSSPNCWVTPATTLNDVLRHHTQFHATKVACNEGGCGACTVALTFTDIVTGKTVTRGINSCLAPVMSLNGMCVTTNDGIGNLQAPHAIQKKLADLSGTQCGYCSSGMVMSMYSFLAENPSPTAAEVEAMLDGNLCRCTGYRPILEAFKTFAVDEHSCDKEKCCKKLNGLPIEIEDAARTLVAPASQKPTPKLLPPQFAVLPRPAAALGGQQAQWIEVDREDKLQYWINHLTGMNVMLVVGATSQALDRVNYDAYIDVHRIPSFNVITQDATGITIGAAVTFTDAINYFEQAVSPSGNADANVAQLRKHFLRVASTLIRNRGCVVGNLVYTHRHQSSCNAFPSDATISLMGIGAKVTLVSASTAAATTVSITDFLATPLTGSYVKSIWIPWAASNETFRSYKIAIRQTLDHAIVNAGMKATVDPKTNSVTGSPIIAVGGIFPSPTRLTAFESAMVGLDVTKASTLTALCTAFTNALASIDPTPGRVEYRKQVALNYFYKFVLSLQPSLPANLANATDVWMSRPVTQASQTFGTKEEEYPVSLPIPKIDGLAQTTGQAVYTGDIPAPFGCVFGALVTTTVANAPITAVNAAAANAVPGFVTYLDASSVSAQANQWMMFGQNICPMFATGTSLWAGQVVGCVFATSETIARDCAAMIQATITYGPSGPIIVEVADAVNPKNKQQPFPGGTTAVSCGDVNTAKPDLTATGAIHIKPQYHFHLENHAVLVQPVEGQLIVDLATQAASNAQVSICNATGLPSSDVVVRTRRCGGGYGGKIIYPSLVASIASVAALLLQRPVRIELTFKDAMRSFGCRPDFEMSYTMGLKKDGTIVSLVANVNGAAGTQGAEAGEIVTILANVDNCYNVHNAALTAATYPSTVPPAAPVRGPGWIQAIAFAEIMMNQVASQVGIAPDTLRQKNLYQNGDTTPNGTWIRGTPVSALWDKMHPHFETRKQDAATFNANSTFVKRGVSINPTRFNVSWGGPFNCLVTIFSDGSITVVHGGTEIGQGINTKVAQGVAFKFGLDAKAVQRFIKIQPTTTTVCASLGNVTGGSVTSEMCTMAVMRACDTLNDRLAPYRTEQQSWEDLIGVAMQNNVDLVATGYGTVQRTTGGPARYNSWGCAVTEVEVDTLTGQFEIKQTDLLFDCGISMNPIIDIGQIEGGFMFGVGWFTSEIVQWDKTTGEAVMAGSWRYKPPGAHDLPEVFNVTLLENSNNTVGVLGSKAVGEPPLALGVSVLLALEDAINSVRKQNGQTPFTVNTVPMTVDDIASACAVASTNFVLPSQ